METGKPGLASAPVHISSVAAQAEKRMDIQAPLTAVYIHTVPALPAQPYPQPPAAAREPATLHLAVPPLYSKETLPFLTLHIAGGLQSQPGLSLAAAAPAVRPKSAGKHVCPHCGRDCMKPSVLEKHLRCHTGERPYPCTTCGVSFKTQSNLYKHRRTQAHARLSSESEQSSLGSLDSMSSSRETCTSSLSLDESSSVEKEATLPAAESTSPASTTRAFSVKTQGSVSEQSELTVAGHSTKPNESDKVAKEEEKQRLGNEKPPLSGSRHLPLQRQEATLFSKQWENSASRGKSQSHESTDSGFSESSDHYMSPSSILPDHSMDSLTESTKEHVEETTRTDTPSESGHGGQEAKDTVREQETLEERISKLISENTAVVEDKQLENVRPRKTVLSKQGSIDLPMPYTYKDSFHFDMRINQNQNFGLQRNRRPELYSSVPTQRSSTVEHAPLTRSNSLPFSVTLLQPERSSPNSSYQSDYVTLARRGSSGQINPTGFTIKPVNQHSSTHRPLVRQTAVDCNHATDGLFRNSSVEEACTSSLSCDGDGGDICGEPSNRKFRRKKAQKFAYNKWYMYGGGTFKKLYNSEKSGDNSAIKGRKCSTNPEHEVVQGLQKRLSVVHKETVTTTGSTINVTNSSVAVALPGCPPASLPLVPAVDSNLQTSHLNSSCSSLKAPLRRNLSLSVLPLPSIGSLVSHKTDGVNRTEAGRLINEEKHTDSSLQLCGAHIPSDRKKQRTDDKIIFPLEMETDPNTLTHPPPSVTGSVSKQDTNLTYIRLQKNPKHTQLQGALFPSCIINANAPSVSTSPATSIPPAAKNSFLPKYQLKLPNAAEPDSNPSPRVVDKPTATSTSPPTQQTSPSITTCEKNCRDSIASPVMQTCEIKKTSAFSSPQDKLVLPCTLVTTLCQSQLNQNSAPTLGGVHNRQFAATTITTSCLQDYQAGLCSTLIQSSKSAVPMQLPKPVAPAVVNFPPTPAATTASNQAAVQDQPYLSSNPPLSQTHLSAATDLSNPGSRAPVGPVVPCHVVPFDQVQSAAQNVFHVHTADLQICLQIISDEHMALIEPQIERPLGSQRSDMEATAPEVVRNKAQSFVTVESSNERSDREHQGHGKETDKSESLPPVNPNRITSSLSLQSRKAQTDLLITKSSNSSQPAAPAESIPPETLDLALQPQKYGHVNTVAETQNSAGDVMSTAASPRGVKSGRSQTLEEQQAFSQNRAEEKLLPDRKVSQGGVVSQTPSSQHKLSVSSPSPSTVHQNSMKREAPSQHKLKNQGASCNVGPTSAKGETSAYKSSRLEGGECLGRADEPSVASFSINKCKTLRRLNPQASIYCSDQVESALPENPNSSKYSNVGCDTAGRPSDSVPSVEITQRESQDVISTAQSERRLGQYVSAEEPKDAPAASIQSSTAGLMEGATQAEREAQKEPQTRDHAGTPGQPDGTDWRPKQSQEAEETNHQYLEERGCSGVMGEDKDREVKTTKVPSQWGKTESSCRYSVLPHVAKPEGEDRKVKADSFKNSRQSEQHLQHLSQTHSGMSEYPPRSSSNNPSLPASSAQANLFNSPQPPLEMNHFYVPQQSWESSAVHDQHTQVQLSEKDPSRTEPHLQPSQTFSDQTSTTPPVQQGNSSTAGSFCNKLTLLDHKDLSFSSDVGILSSTQVSNVCRAAAGFMGEMSKSNQNTGPPSKPFTEPEEKQDTIASPNDYTSNSSSSGRSDFASKYQSIFLTGPLHGYQPDCLTGAVRPVQSCQDYTEDTSSSDDEGKLIIEL